MPSTRLAFRGWLVATLLASCIGCDQVTKKIARTELKGRPAQSFCQDLLRLEYAENAGAFLGLGGGLPASIRWTLLVVVNSTIAGGMAGALALRRDMIRWHLTACALMLAGAVGNLIDRLRFDGMVIDFLNLGIGPLRTGIFNIADVAILFGALLWVAPSLVAPVETTEKRSQ